MTDAGLAELAEGVRTAIDANEFDRALGVWSDYAAALCETLALDPSPARLSEASDLLAHARRTVEAFRIRALEQIDAIEVGQRYSRV